MCVLLHCCGCVVVVVVVCVLLSRCCSHLNAFCVGPVSHMLLCPRTAVILSVAQSGGGKSGGGKSGLGGGKGGKAKGGKGKAGSKKAPSKATQLTPAAPSSLVKAALPSCAVILQ